MIYNVRPRLGDTTATGRAYVTASIVSQSSADGSPLDSAPSIEYCGPNVDCTFALSMIDGQPAGITDSGASTGHANGTSATGGAGSGGVYPFGGGLPLNLPSLGLPTLPKWIYWALGSFAALVVIKEIRQ